VKAGEKIPADGVVIDGKSYIDESMLTGKNKPVLKKEGDEVYEGTINTDGFLKIKVNNPQKEWTLNKQIYRNDEGNYKFKSSNNKNCRYSCSIVFSNNAYPCFRSFCILVYGRRF